MNGKLKKNIFGADLDGGLACPLYRDRQCFTTDKIETSAEALIFGPQVFQKLCQLNQNVQNDLTGLMFISWAVYCKGEDLV